MTSSVSMTSSLSSSFSSFPSSFSASSLLSSTTTAGESTCVWMASLPSSFLVSSTVMDSIKWETAFSKYGRAAETIPDDGESVPSSTASRGFIKAGSKVSCTTSLGIEDPATARNSLQDSSRTSRSMPCVSPAPSPFIANPRPGKRIRPEEIEITVGILAMLTSSGEKDPDDIHARMERR